MTWMDNFLEILGLGMCAKFSVYEVDDTKSDIYIDFCDKITLEQLDAVSNFFVVPRSDITIESFTDDEEVSYISVRVKFEREIKKEA